MADTRMVLRTVYLTPDIDEELRLGAFRAGRTKNDLIRDAIKLYLDAGGGAKDGAQRVAQAARVLNVKKKPTRRAPSLASN